MRRMSNMYAMHHILSREVGVSSMLSVDAVACALTLVRDVRCHDVLLAVGSVVMAARTATEPTASATQLCELIVTAVEISYYM